MTTATPPEKTAEDRPEATPFLRPRTDDPIATNVPDAPRNPRTGVFTRPVVTLMVVGGLWSAAVNMGLFAGMLHSGRSLREAMAVTFVSLVLIQFFKAYNFRSDHHSALVRLPPNLTGWRMREKGREKDGLPEPPKRARLLANSPKAFSARPSAFPIRSKGSV